MILLVSTRAARGAYLFIAAALFLFLSYFSVRQARAAHEIGRENAAGYERATKVEPGDARNWYLAGHYWQYNIDQPDLAKAVRAYQTSLSLNPLSADTWLDLGTTYEMEGNISEARKSYLQAKRVYPLSAEVSWRYGNFLLRQSELDQAFPEIRRAVEVRPQYGGEAFSRCWRAAPNLDLILDRVIPPNTEVYLAVLLDLVSEYQTEPAMKVWSRLEALHPNLHLRDVTPFVNLLIRGSRMETARSVWEQAAQLANLPPFPTRPGSVIWDGGFESGEDVEGFGWEYPPFVNGVQVSLDTHEKHSGKQSLRLQFGGRRNVDFDNACTVAPVESGTPYHFSAWVRTKALTTEEGVRFSLRAIDAQAARTVLTPDVRGSEPWTLVEGNWISEKDAHGVHICVRRNATRRLDDEIRGTAWVDDVALIAQKPGASHP